MRESDAEIVRNLTLFRDCSAENFDALIAGGYLQRFPTGVVLIHEGERPDFLHVLVEGKVDMYSAISDHETTLALLSPPAAFILAAVIVDGPYLKSVRTLAPSTIVLIPADAVRSVFLSDQAFARAIVVELAQRYRAVVKDIKNLRLRTTLERLANWLLAEDKAQGGAGTFRLAVEKRVLANQLGMRPENLSRCIAELAHLGAEFDGLDVRITNRRALVDFCRPNPLIDDPST